MKMGFSVNLLLILFYQVLCFLFRLQGIIQVTKYQF